MCTLKRACQVPFIKWERLRIGTASIEDAIARPILRSIKDLIVSISINITSRVQSIPSSQYMHAALRKQASLSFPTSQLALFLIWEFLRVIYMFYHVEYSWYIYICMCMHLVIIWSLPHSEIGSTYYIYTHNIQVEKQISFLLAFYVRSRNPPHHPPITHMTPNPPHHHCPSCSKTLYIYTRLSQLYLFIICDIYSRLTVAPQCPSLSPYKWLFFLIAKREGGGGKTIFLFFFMFFFFFSIAKTINDQISHVCWNLPHLTVSIWPPTLTRLYPSF